MPVFHVSRKENHDLIRAEGIKPAVLHGREMEYPRLSSPHHAYFWRYVERAHYWLEHFCGPEYEVWECHEPETYEHDPNICDGYRTYEVLKPIRTLGPAELEEAYRNRWE